MNTLSIISNICLAVVDIVLIVMIARGWKK